MNLTHTDNNGNATQVDVGEKEVTTRVAIAGGFIKMQSETLALVKTDSLKKGDVLTTAKIAGIMASKNTAGIIPLCHNLPLDSVNVDFYYETNGIRVTAVAKCTGKTGVEMEALTAVSVACLTIYDMAKAVDKTMEIGEIVLLEKSGGKSGHFKRG